MAVQVVQTVVDLVVVAALEVMLAMAVQALLEVRLFLLAQTVPVAVAVAVVTQVQPEQALRDTLEVVLAFILVMTAREN